MHVDEANAELDALHSITTQIMCKTTKRNERRSISKGGLQEFIQRMGFSSSIARRRFSQEEEGGKAGDVAACEPVHGCWSYQAWLFGAWKVIVAARRHRWVDEASILHCSDCVDCSRASRSTAGPSSAKKCRGFVLSKHHDGTPIEVAFGSLQDLLLPCARFAHKGPDGLWKMLPWSEYCQVTKQRIAPRKGVVEVFAQLYRCAWMDENNVQYRYKVLAPPMFLQVGNASTVHGATDHSFKNFSIDRLKELADRNRFMMIHEAPDNVAYNRRHEGYTAIARLPINIWYSPGGCVAHLSRLNI